MEAVSICLSGCQRVLAAALYDDHRARIDLAALDKVGNQGHHNNCDKHDGRPVEVVDGDRLSIGPEACA